MRITHLVAEVVGSEKPSLRSIQKAVRSLKEDVDEVQDARRSSQRQLLWTMRAQVRKDRAESSCQLVAQGFQPWTEATNPIEAFRCHNQWRLTTCSRLSGVPPELIKMSCSHGTAADKLSRLTIITLQSSSLTSAIARAAGNQKHHFSDTTTVSIRRQTCVYDRLVSAPVKIAMECVSRSHPQLRNRFRPSWRDGHLWGDDAELLGIW